MFKSCCSGSNKKKLKNKNNSENMENAAENTDRCEAQIKSSEETETCQKEMVSDFVNSSPNQKPGVDLAQEDSNTKASAEDDEEQNDSFQSYAPKSDFSKKRFSVDFKRNRLEFKRYSVDCRTESESLEQLQQLEKLEHELAKTNMEVRPGKRRQSSGILKSTTSSNELEHRMLNTNESVSDEDEVFESSDGTGKAVDGSRDTPATPVGRDELALRRHRFFSDLVCAARAAVEHRVRFDPLGPVIADSALEAEALAAVSAPAAQLESLLERLERVTSRLENLQVLRESSPAPTPPEPSVIRTDSTDNTVSPVSQPADDFVATDNMSVNGYQDLVQGPLQSYLSLSKQIGGDVAAHANLVNAAFQAQLRYIQLATSRSKPAQAEEVKLLAPTSDQITAIQQFREKNRVSPFFNHLSAISESIPALGWVAVSPTPAPYVKEMNDAGQFYTNRVLKDWKEKDKRHAEWCRAWVQVLTDLQAYVKQHHTTGLVWSGKGGAPPPPPGGMPPPPPVLPEVDFANMSVDDRSALFAQINQGENITSNLRKVKPEMQTHKNPNLRQGPAPFKAGNATGPTKALPTPGAGTFADKAPVFTRDGKKWLIEYQKGNSNIVVDNADMNNVVYMFRCRDSALTVRGKINGIVMDSCTKCAVVFENLVSSIEFVNCQSVQMQVLGKVPTISIDKTDGCQMYLSPESLAVEIVSSKSSEMNILLPKGNGDYTEHPIPEQYKTVLNKGALTTTPVESKG